MNIKDIKITRLLPNDQWEENWYKTQQYQTRRPKFQTIEVTFSNLQTSAMFSSNKIK